MGRKTRKTKKRAEAGSESFRVTVEILERFQASRLAPAGLRTTSTLDLGSVSVPLTEASAHYSGNAGSAAVKSLSSRRQATEADRAL